MTSFFTSAPVAVSKPASQIAGYRVGAGRRAGGMGTRRNGPPVEPATLVSKNLPAIVVHCNWSSGAARTAAFLTDCRARGIAPVGLLNLFRLTKAAGSLSTALVKFFQKPTSGPSKWFKSPFVNLLHGNDHDRRKRQSAVRV